MKIRKEIFGTAGNNKEVSIFSLQNNNGITIKIITYGGIITSLSAPDKYGNIDNIVLGFDSLDEYTNSKYTAKCPYLGAIIGRYANRIASGKFSLAGKEYKLVNNDGPNHLHGGTTGFDKVIWKPDEINANNQAGLKMTYFSPDMEEGYPGNLNITVTYTLTEQNELKIEYKGTVDKPCPVNLTQHSYFNLNSLKGNILDHELFLNADKYTISDENLIPTGELTDVKSTPLDFRNPCKIGEKILQLDDGYDHNFVLNKNHEGELTLAARVSEPLSGRILEMYTTEPGVQLYTGNYLNGSFINAGGITIHKHFGFCLEAQHYPDSPNKPQFPSTILNPHEKYYQLTVYKFLI
jgi:aldose 1-epimerase